MAEPAGTRTIAAAIGDYDDDGWPDIFVSGFGTHNRLYHSTAKQRKNRQSQIHQVPSRALNPHQDQSD